MIGRVGEFARSVQWIKPCRAGSCNE